MDIAERNQKIEVTNGDETAYFNFDDNMENNKLREEIHNKLLNAYGKDETLEIAKNLLAQYLEQEYKYDGSVSKDMMYQPFKDGMTIWFDIIDANGNVVNKGHKNYDLGKDGVYIENITDENGNSIGNEPISSELNAALKAADCIATLAESKEPHIYGETCDKVYYGYIKKGRKCNS